MCYFIVFCILHSPDTFSVICTRMFLINYIVTNGVFFLLNVDKTPNTWIKLLFIWNCIHIFFVTCKTITFQIVLYNKKRKFYTQSCIVYLTSFDIFNENLVIFDITVL